MCRVYGSACGHPFGSCHTRVSPTGDTNDVIMELSGTWFSDNTPDPNLPQIIVVVTETRRQSIPLTNPRRLFSGLSVLGLTLMLLTGCVVPGGYDVNSLHLLPEAGLVYPGSTGVHTNDYGGSPGNYIGKGAVAATGKSATTVHTQLEVLAYFSQNLAAGGWTQTGADDTATTPEGFRAKEFSWVKNSLHLSYLVRTWTVGETTQHFTRLSANE